jgi:hypothetical protein
MITKQQAKEMLISVGCTVDACAQWRDVYDTLSQFQKHWELHFDEQNLKALSRDEMIRQSRMIDVLLNERQ